MAGRAMTCCGKVCPDCGYGTDCGECEMCACKGQPEPAPPTVPNSPSSGGVEPGESTLRKPATLNAVSTKLARAIAALPKHERPRLLVINQTAPGSPCS